MKYLPVIAFLLLIAPLVACESYRTPTVSSDATKMSDQTLCYRAQTTGKQVLKDEAKRRRLDCRAMVENDPLLQNQRY